MAAHKSQILFHFLGIQADTFQVNLAESWTCGSTPAPASAWPASKNFLLKTDYLR